MGWLAVGVLAWLGGWAINIRLAALAEIAADRIDDPGDLWPQLVGDLGKYGARV